VKLDTKTLRRVALCASLLGLLVGLFCWGLHIHGTAVPRWALVLSGVSTGLGLAGVLEFGDFEGPHHG